LVRRFSAKRILREEYASCLTERALLTGSRKYRQALSGSGYRTKTGKPEVHLSAFLLFVLKCPAARRYGANAKKEKTYGGIL